MSTPQYCGIYKLHDSTIKQKVHYTGNNIKAMHISFEDSLKKLRTHYIDIFYVHWVCIFGICFSYS